MTVSPTSRLMGSVSVSLFIGGICGTTPSPLAGNVVVVTLNLDTDQLWL